MRCDGLTIDHYADAGGVILRLRGELDSANAPEVAATLACVIDDSTGDVEVDLDGVEFVGVAGVRLLLELSRGMDAVHRRLSLVHPTPIFARMIESIGAGDAAAADEPPYPLARRAFVTPAAGRDLLSA